MKTLTYVLLFLLFACESTTQSEESTEGSKTQLKVAIISNSGADITHVVSTWTSFMPNFELLPVNADTLKLKDLDSADVVLFFENGNFAKSTAVGDTLYEFVMDGGKLLLGTFYGQGRTNTKYTGTNYGALELIDPVLNHNNAYSNDTLVVKSKHPLLEGITTLTTHYGAGDDSLKNNAKLIEKWKNGDVLAAYNEPAGRILYLSIWPAEDNQTLTYINDLKSFYRIWANAIRFAYNKTSSSADFSYSLEVESSKYMQIPHLEENQKAQNKTGAFK